MADIFRAALVSTNRAIQLLPSGNFRSGDGRPRGIAYWKMDGAIAARLIAASNAKANDIVIDYEHQTLRTDANGKPAPAAGWFKRLEYREGIGLFATDVRWTPAAMRMIQAGEYRYLSPVFSYSKKDGEVESILHAGLTNVPALDGMDVVALRGGMEESRSLTPEDHEVCRLMGMSTSTFISGKVTASNKLSTNEVLSFEQLAVCRALDLSPLDFFKTL